MLTLPIKKKWFDMIRKGIKLEEYREIKPYYESRFSKLWQGSLIGGEAIREIKLKNGYSANAPFIIAECKIRIGKGKTEWGAEKDKEYYILDIQGIRETVRGVINVCTFDKIAEELKERANDEKRT